jgi:hypothetical protein
MLKQLAEGDQRRPFGPKGLSDTSIWPTNNISERGIRR